MDLRSWPFRQPPGAAPLSSFNFFSAARGRWRGPNSFDEADPTAARVLQVRKQPFSSCKWRPAPDSSAHYPGLVAVVTHKKLMLPPEHLIHSRIHPSETRAVSPAGKL